MELTLEVGTRLTLEDEIIQELAQYYTQCFAKEDNNKEERMHARD